MLASKSLFHPYLLDCFLKRLAQLEIPKTLRETHRPVGKGKWELNLAFDSTPRTVLFFGFGVLFCLFFSVNSTGSP